MKVTKLLRQGCMSYLYYGTEVKDEQMRIQDIPVVYEFPDVFLEELSGLPPKRKIDFEIKLISYAQPISKAPYRMTPIELK